tara:strand:- start:428 stop:766 length:339 start_codon:yes stop_codon:yes gene_type:complete
MYKLRGQIQNIKIEDIKTAKGDFKKMTFTLDETDTGFNHVYQFELFGESAIELQKDKIKKDSYATIHFYIKSREYKDRYYNTLMVKDVFNEDWSDNISKEDIKFNKKNDVPF